MPDDARSTSGTEQSLGKCDTEGCHRKAVVTHKHADPENMSGSVEADFCLPCRRVIEHARGIPWNDEADHWVDKEALHEFIEGRDVDRRHFDMGTERGEE